MNIDWFTFVAQIVNFLVLVALLRWLLYDRVIHAMEEREAKIAHRLEKADQKRTEAEAKAEHYEQKSREIDEQREDVLKEAHRKAEEERQRLSKENKEEAERKRKELQQAFQRERDSLVSELRRKVGQMGVKATRRTLSQLANADLERQMYDAFVAHLRKLDDEQREALVRPLKDNGADVSIRSAFDMADEWRERIHETLRDTLEHDAEISFEKEADLICGVELNVGGYSFGWNVKEFLHDLELGLDEQLKSARR